MEKKQQQSGLSSGFLLGVVVGVIVTLLLTTKRGKRILKLITQEGINKISNWEDVFTDVVDEYETKPQEPKEKPVDFLDAGEAEDEVTETEVLQTRTPQPKLKQEETKSSPKRFFKGIHRRVIN